MSLPYTPVVRGFTPTWVYEHLEEVVADGLKNVYGITSLKDREKFFIAREKLDPRVAPGMSLPAVVLRILSIDCDNSLRPGLPETLYSPGEIVHQGTGTDQVELIGSHKGNNRYVCEITASGTVGTNGSYQLRKTPWTGTAWGTEVVVSSGSIPASGEIETGDGTLKIVFTVGQQVVGGDTYSWETEAYKVRNRQGRTVKLRARVEIFFFALDEAVWDTNNPLDQLFLMFPRRWYPVTVYTDRYVEIEEKLVRIAGSWDRLPYGRGREETLVDAFKISVDLTYQGPDNGAEPVMFSAEISPLVTDLDLDEDHDIHEQVIP